MKINQAQDALIKKLIAQWKEEGIIDETQASKMEKSYQVAGFDWQNLAFIAFFFAIISIILAVSLLIADQWLMHFLESLITTSTIYKILFFLVLSAGLYYWAYLRSIKYPFKVYSNEGFFLLGASTTAISLVYMAFAWGNLYSNYALLLLAATVTYAIIGIKLKSKINWLLALIGIGCWYGAFTFDGLNDRPFFIGMNLPVRFLPLGGLIAIMGYFIQMKIKGDSFYGRSTFMAGLIYFLLALWLATIFGNFGELNAWYDATHIQLLPWSIIAGIMCLLFIYSGLKWKEYVLRDLGFIFLLLNLYTRYFEYFWDRFHISVFFMVLGISFWLIGKQAEKFWQKSGMDV